MKLFNYEGPFMRFMLLLSRLTILNLLWLVCCIPVVTAGAATAAQYYAVSRLIDGDAAVFKNFRAGFRLHWKRATAVWIFLAALCAAFAMTSYTLSITEMPGRQALSVISALAFVSLFMVMLWFFPVMLNFRGTLREIIFNSFVFAFMYAPVTLIAVVLYGVLVFLFLRFYLVRGLIVLFGQALMAYAISVLFGRVFRKYKE